MSEGATIPSVPSRPFIGSADTVLTLPFTCAKCGYNLQGLRLGGLCPECGTPVSHSVTGDIFAQTPSSIVREMNRGAALISNSISLAVTGPAVLAVPLLILLATTAAQADPTPAWLWRLVLMCVLMVVVVLAATMQLRGWRLLLQPHKRKPVPDGRDRWIIAWIGPCAWGSSVCLVLSTLGALWQVWTLVRLDQSDQRSPIFLLTIAAAAAFIVFASALWFTGGRYVAWLLRNVAHRKGAAGAAWSAMLLPAGGLVMGGLLLLLELDLGFGCLSVLLIPMSGICMLVGLVVGLESLGGLLAILPHVAKVREAVERDAAPRSDPAL